MARRAQRGPALILAAGLAFGPAAPLVAQQPDTAFTEIVVQLRIERGPERTVVALARDSLVYVPLRAFLELAEVKITKDSTGHRLAGLLEPGAVPWWIDFDLATHGRGTAAAGLAPGDAVWREGELYVFTPIADEMFGVRFRIDWQELSLTATRSDQLPVRQRLEREGRRAIALAAMARQAGPQAPLARVATPLAEAGALDYSATVASERPDQNYTVGAGLGMELAGGSLTYVGTFQQAGALQSSTGLGNWTRAWPDSRVVRQLRLGDTYAEGLRYRNYRGGTVTNVPFLRPSPFETDALTGSFTDGWQIELLRSGELISYTTTDPSGHYRLPVPLAYGPNPLEMRAYGPNGEVVQRSLAWEVPFTRLSSRQFEYVLGGGRCSSDPCAGELVADARYGLSDRLTVRSGVEGFQHSTGPDTWHPYAAATASLASSLLLSFDGTVTGLAQTRAVYAPSPDLRVEAGHLSFDPSADKTLFGAGSDTGRDELFLFWRPAGRSLQFQGSAVDHHGAVPHTTLILAPSLRIPSATLTLSAHEDLAGGTGGVTTSGVDGMVSGLVPRGVPVLGMTLLTALLQTRCDAGMLACTPDVVSWRLGLGRQLFMPLRLDAVVSWIRGGATVFELSATTTLSYLRAITRTGYSPDQAYTSTQSVEGSVLWDRRGGRVRFDDGRSVGLGGVAGVVFRDANGNGVQDPEEAGVPNVLVRVGSRAVLTDSLGRFSSFELEPFERSVVEVDTLALEDPTWVPAHRGMAVRPLPNGFLHVSLPLAPAQELSGMVTLEGRGLPQVKVHARNLDTGEELILTTFDDGAFYTPSARPGTYELTVERDLLERLHAFFAPRRVALRMGRPPEAVRLELTGGTGH